MRSVCLLFILACSLSMAMGDSETSVRQHQQEQHYGGMPDFRDLQQSTGVRPSSWGTLLMLCMLFVASNFFFAPINAPGSLQMETTGDVLEKHDHIPLEEEPAIVASLTAEDYDTPVGPASFDAEQSEVEDATLDAAAPEEPSDSIVSEDFVSSEAPNQHAQLEVEAEGNEKTLLQEEEEVVVGHIFRSKTFLFDDDQAAASLAERCLIMERSQKKVLEPCVGQNLPARTLGAAPFQLFTNSFDLSRLPFAAVEPREVVKSIELRVEVPAASSSIPELGGFFDLPASEFESLEEDMENMECCDLEGFEESFKFEFDDEEVQVKVNVSSAKKVVPLSAQAVPFEMTSPSKNQTRKLSASAAPFALKTPPKPTLENNSKDMPKTSQKLFLLNASGKPNAAYLERFRAIFKREADAMPQPTPKRRASKPLLTMPVIMTKQPPMPLLSKAAPISLMGNLKSDHNNEALLRGPQPPAHCFAWHGQLARPMVM